MTFRAEFGQMLRYHRQQKGYNQRELADAIRRSKSMISDWERGRCRPELTEDVFSIMTLLAVPAVDFFTDESATYIDNIVIPGQNPNMADYMAPPREFLGSQFGAVIKEQRERYGYSLREVAHCMGVDTRTVRRWENGGSFPEDGWTVLTLALKMCMPIEEFCRATYERGDGE